MEYRVLGPLEVLDEGRRLELGGPRQRAVLAVLLLRANQVVPADRLAEELWPEGPPRSAAKAIQVYVSALRKAFGVRRDALETRGPGYVLRVGQGELDLHEFERLVERARREEPEARAATLRSALALWRGAPLADFAYEPFVQVEAARLEELRVLALEDRIEADLARGHGAELVTEIQSLVRERPLQERPRAQLMRALYRAGRQADALEVFREGREALDAEVGLEPGQALRDLERAILRHDEGLSAPVAADGPSVGRIVAIGLGQPALGGLAPLAGALARTPAPRELVVVRIAPAPELSTATAELDECRRDLAADGASVRIAAFSSAAPAADVVRLASQQDADLLLLATDGDPLRGPFAGVFGEATCDVGALVDQGGPPGDGPVVVPFGAFEHDWAALELGAWAAQALARPLRLVGAADEVPGGRDASRLLADASLIVQHTAGVVAEPFLGRPGREGIAASAEGAGLLVLGLSERWQMEGLGETRAALVQAPLAPTLLVRRGLRPSGIAPQVTLTRFTWSIAHPTIRD